MIKQTAITMLGAAALISSAQAEVEYEISAGAHSEYIFRGIDQNGGQLIDTSITASTEVNGNSFHANVWYGTTGTTGFDELDVTLGWEKALEFGCCGELSVFAGGIFYEVIDAGNTTELYLGLGKDLGAGVSGSLTYYNDVDDADSEFDEYLELAFSKDFAVTDAFTANLEAKAGYLLDQERFINYQFTASTSYDLTETASLTPYLSYSLNDLAPDDELFGGVALTVSF